MRKLNFKKYFIFATYFVVFFCCNFLANSQNVGINTTGGVPNASAGLDINFTDKGLLIPRVVLVATNNASPVTTPSTSLLVYNTNTITGVNGVTPGFYYWNGSLWVRLQSGSLVDTDDQTLSLNGDTLFIQDGNYVTLIDRTFDGDSSITNELQTISRSNDTIFLSNGGFVVLENNGVPTGATFAFPDSIPPMGYLECDGAAISRTTYSRLFALIGTRYGAGDGSTTFNLPDYRGQFLRGYDHGAGTDPDAAGRLNRGDGGTGDLIGTKQNTINLRHLHSVDPPAASTSAGGAHTHTTYARNIYTNTSGAHSHVYARATSTSTHSHGIYTRTQTIRGGTNGAYYTIHGLTSSNPRTTSASSTVYSSSNNTSNTGQHAHSAYLPALGTSNSGNHSHNFNIGSFNSGYSGGNESRPINVSVMWCMKY